MIQDKVDTYCRQLAVTATAGTDYINHGAPVRSLGDGLKVVVSIDGADMTDAASNSTITPSLEGCDEPTFGSPTTLCTGPAFAALSVKGSKVELDPGFWPAAFQYTRVKFTTANGDLTTGKFTAQIVKGVQNTHVYPMAGGITS